eukprot:TRINITY_DN9093_c0_g1_i1.p1 TRINITY_DN9093_c0_g1~~TRINITY_DN9093_c0_g1_i1.p1  ORF type:complete len:296 (+),score=47.17 TRINITY_DN9093_c0_g1_i1:144-1031(+)
MSKHLQAFILAVQVAGDLLAAAQSNPFASASGEAGAPSNPFATASGVQKAESTPPVKSVASAPLSAPAPPPAKAQASSTSSSSSSSSSSSYNDLAGSSMSADPVRKLAEEKAKKQYELDVEFNAACVGGNTTEIDSILKRNAQIDNDIHGWTQLSIASMGETANNVEVALYLLANRADPDAADTRGRTPLYFAVKHNYSSIVKEMLKTAKNLETADGNGVQALTRAVWMEYTPIVRDLIKAGHPIAQGMAAASGDDVSWEIKQLFNLTTTTTTTTRASPTTKTTGSNSSGRAGDL